MFAYLVLVFGVVYSTRYVGIVVLVFMFPLDELFVIIVCVVAGYFVAVWAFFFLFVLWKML
jgi:hypothetical protein